MIFDPIYLTIIITVSAVSWYVSNKLKSKFKRYSQMHLERDLTGKQIAELMLVDHGIHDVQVVSVGGQLTDHYDPEKKTVNLSEVVYNSRNAAATAVAAHEVGHAVQHAQAYSWLQMRSSMVPAVQFSSRFNGLLIMAGVMMMAFSFLPKMGFYVAVLGVILFGVATLFSFVTLPVEYDASRRALAWVKNRQIVTSHEFDAAEDALKWAARTYVVAALGSLAQLLYWVMVIMSRRD